MEANQMRKFCDVVLTEILISVCTFIQVARDKAGATIIEYGLLAGLVGLVVFAGFLVTGTAVAGMFDSISTVFTSSVQPSP